MAWKVLVSSVFKSFQSCLPWSTNTCSGWMPGKQLHHGEVLLEGGVKGGLCQRPGHRRHWTLGASCGWNIYSCSENSFRWLRLSLYSHLLYFPLRFICSFGSEPVPRGHQQLLSSLNATNAPSFALLHFLLVFFLFFFFWKVF